MNGIAHLPAFLLAAALMILVPGPATLYVAGQVRYSTRRGYLATLGIIGGDVILIAFSGLGFATLVHTWPLLLEVIKVCGGLYLAFLGLAMYNSPAPEAAPGSAGADSVFQALLVTLTNPKSILFFAAFFPLFIDRSTGTEVQSYYLLGFMFEALNIVYFATVVALVSHLRTLPAASRLPLHKLSACALMLCSVFVLTA
ncbi:MAG: LysE family transporter [Pseudomonadota bacterium]